MKRLIFGAAVCSLLFGLTTFAQDRDRDRDRGDDRFYGGHLFERVRADLDRVQDESFPLSPDRQRVHRAKEQLNDLQRGLESHNYDPRKLSEVIETMQWVANNNHLRPRDRDALSDDLARLREFRERHEEWREREHER